MTTRIAVRKSLLPKQKRSPMSPRLKPPKPVVPQSKIDRVNLSYVSIADQKLMTLPPSAQTPTVLCLDLENNRMSSSALQKIGKNVGALNLSKNPLLDLKLPLLTGLRSLSINECGLRSFAGIPQFPHLRYLSATGNKLQNFKGLPIFGKLERIDLRNNPVEFSSKLTISAVGSVFLHTFNEEVLTEDKMREAFSLSPLVGVALRMGRTAESFDSVEEELRVTQEFLTKDLVKALTAAGMSTDVTSLNVVTYNGEATLICPWESDNVKWYRSTGGKGPEWDQIRPEDGSANKGPANMLPLTMMMRMHLVKCEFVLNGKTYAVYTDWPVGKEPNDLSLPYPHDAIIAGWPIEGSLVSLIPSDRPGRVAWTKGDETLAEDVPSIRLSNADVGSVVTCLLQPYCPTFPSVVFSTVFVETGEVEPQLPTVSGIVWPEHMIEGQKITFEGKKVDPDREGDSQILIERARSPSGEWFLLTELTKDCIEYTPTTSDIGHFLRMSYVPVTVEGEKGEPTFFYSQSKVLPTLPAFKNAVIGGLPKTHYPMVALADYTGGQKGHCACNWYFSKSRITSANMKGLKKVAEDTIFFTPGEEHANGFLAIEMVPVRNDEVIGETVYAALVGPIVKDDPPEPLINAPTRAMVGEVIEMKQTCAFFVSDTKGFCGFQEVKRGTTFRPRSKQAGKVLRIVTDTSDHIVGVIQPALPVVTKVEIQYDKPQAGATATVEITEKNLAPDRFELLWMRCQQDIEWVVAVDVAEYTFTKEDVGFQMKVRVTPMDHEGKWMKYTESRLTPSILPGYVDAPQIVSNHRKGRFNENGCVELVYDKDFTDVTWLHSDPKNGWVPCKTESATDYGNKYQLKSSDVGRYLRCQFKVGASTLFATTEDVVRPLKPKVHLSISGDNAVIYEGDTLNPIISYCGGKPGQHIYEWKKLQVLEAKVVGNTPTYEVKPNDVGSTLVFTMIPVRSDKVRGKPVSIQYSQVLAKEPVVTDVTIKQNDQGFIECVGKYSGGNEGPSQIEWRAIDPEGKVINIGKSCEKTFLPPPQLNGYFMEATYRPVREDGVRGEPVATSNRVTVEPIPVVDTVDILCKNGRIEVGNVMRCKAVCNDGSKVEYQWYRGDGVSQWTMIEDARKMDYTPCDMDLGWILCCLVEPVNAKGWRGKGISAATPGPVEEGDIKLAVVARRNRFKTGVELDTTYKTEVQWEREINKEWIIVARDEKYLLTANDMGHRIRAAFQDEVSKPTPVIEMEPEILSYVKATVRAKSMKFQCRAKLGTTTWQALLTSAGVSLKGKNVDKSAKWDTVKCEAVEGTTDQMVLWLDPSTKFTLVPSVASDVRLAKAVGDNVRDFVVAVISRFNQQQ